MQEVIARMKERGLDGLFLNNNSNIRYVSGFTGADSYIFLLPDSRYFITDYRYTEQAERESSSFQIITVDREFETMEHKLAELIARHNVKSVAFEERHASYQLVENLRTALPGVALTPADDLVEQVRYVKTEEEIAKIKQASVITDKVFEEMLGYLQPGNTEVDLAFTLERLIRENGGDDIAFPVIILSGKNTSMPHGIPSRKKVEKGDFITLDFGALFQGYRTDMTRTVIIGKPDKQQRKVYDMVKGAQEQAVAAMVAGVPGIAVDRVVKNFFARFDYLPFAGKGCGHGLGLDIHERPFMNAKCTDILQENCVVTMEPGLYIPLWGGVRIEDTVLVQSHGREILSKSPKELLIL